MKITVKSQKELKAKTTEYRAKGYQIITFTNKLMELEKDNNLIIIEVSR